MSSNLRSAFGLDGSARGSTDVLLHEACGDTRQRERSHGLPRAWVEDEELGGVAFGHEDPISPAQRTAVASDARAPGVHANEVTPRVRSGDRAEVDDPVRGRHGLKADPDLVDIPAIMLTMLDEKNLGYTLGASDYLTKPIDRERLRAQLA